jgi:hypothetical protein
LALAAICGYAHVFFNIWIRQATEDENRRVNSAIVANVLDALSGEPVEHVARVTGLKHYLGPFERYAEAPAETPFRENQGRLEFPNFYYDQEDVLIARPCRSRAYPGQPEPSMAGPESVWDDLAVKHGPNPASSASSPSAAPTTPSATPSPNSKPQRSSLGSRSPLRPEAAGRPPESLQRPPLTRPVFDDQSVRRDEVPSLEIVTRIAWLQRNGAHLEAGAIGEVHRQVPARPEIRCDNRFTQKDLRVRRRVLSVQRGEPPFAALVIPKFEEQHLRIARVGGDDLSAEATQQVGWGDILNYR